MKPEMKHLGRCEAIDTALPIKTSAFRVLKVYIWGVYY
jgi:hypothetical protein